jgi:hypothetical protein
LTTPPTDELTELEPFDPHMLVKNTYTKLNTAQNALTSHTSGFFDLGFEWTTFPEASTYTILASELACQARLNAMYFRRRWSQRPAQQGRG